PDPWLSKTIQAPGNAPEPSGRKKNLPHPADSRPAGSDPPPVLPRQPSPRLWNEPTPSHIHFSPESKRSPDSSPSRLPRSVSDTSFLLLNSKLPFIADFRSQQ